MRITECGKLPRGIMRNIDAENVPDIWNAFPNTVTDDYDISALAF